MNTYCIILELRHAVGSFLVHYKTDRHLNHDFAECDRYELKIFERRLHLYKILN